MYFGNFRFRFQCFWKFTTTFQSLSKWLKILKFQTWQRIKLKSQYRSYHIWYFHSLMTRTFWRQNIQSTSLEVLCPFYILDPILQSDAPPSIFSIRFSDWISLSFPVYKLLFWILKKHLQTWLRCVNIIYNIQLSSQKRTHYTECRYAECRHSECLGAFERNRNFSFYFLRQCPMNISPINCFSSCLDYKTFYNSN
jgi:hypothetical protein